MLTPISELNESVLLPIPAVGPQSLSAYRSSSDRSMDRRQEFDRILSHSLPRFRRIAMRFLRNREDAEDAVQDAMLSAHRHIERFDGRSQMSTWITSIVINAVRMQIRRRSRRPTLSLEGDTQDSNRKVDEWPVDPGPTPEQSLLRRDLQLLVFDLIAHLPPVQRDALRLRQQDLSIKQVAELFGIPVGTVKARLARARSELSRRFHKITGATKTQTPHPESMAIRKSRSSTPRTAERVPVVPIEVFQSQGGSENWISA